MDITTTLANGKSLIDIPSSLDVMTSPHIKKALNEAVSAADEIELDFSKTKLLSSAGLRVLIQAHKSVKALGKKLTMKNVPPNIIEIFDMTNLTKTFDII